MQKLRVRMYNVLFGDAILVSIPETDRDGNDRILHLLIDVGNHLAGSGGDNAVFQGVFNNIRNELNGAPIDLYLMTHEHLDHIQGPLYCVKKLNSNLSANHVWMTASSAEDYYKRFKEARKKRSLGLTIYKNANKFLTKNASPIPPGITTLLEINNINASKDCVDYIRKLSPQQPLYVHREADIKGKHPFQQTKIRVLAPEEDTSIYYGRLSPRTLGLAMDDVTPASLPAESITPPAGVSAGDFFDLIRFRSTGMTENLKAIDKAANNTSVVIELEWKGWRLLFAGDVEEKSWEIMDRLDQLRPVHFLKVSHHGSKNGTPPVVLEKVLPALAPDDRQRYAAVSVYDDTYSGVPDSETLKLLSTRAELIDTRALEPGEWIDLEFAS